MHTIQSCKSYGIYDIAFLNNRQDVRHNIALLASSNYLSSRTLYDSLRSNCVDLNTQSVRHVFITPQLRNDPGQRRDVPVHCRALHGTGTWDPPVTNVTEGVRIYPVVGEMNEDTAARNSRVCRAAGGIAPPGMVRHNE
jgi:hypothetical protein